MKTKINVNGTLKTFEVKPDEGIVDIEVELPTQGGTALWVRCPTEINVKNLVREAAKRGILIEPDGHYYSTRKKVRNYLNSIARLWLMLRKSM